MTDTNRRFSIITLHPHWGQYIISQGMAFLISCALFLAAGHDSITYKMPFVVLGSIMTCIMLYGCLYIHKLSYIITSEQLIIQHGVLIRKSDYIELYRVVDFSGDRSNPKLDIFGINERIDVVGIIRKRVEYNKQRKGIYEITNR